METAKSRAGWAPERLSAQVASSLGTQGGSKDSVSCVSSAPKDHINAT